MEDVKLYTVFNNIQREGSSNILKEFGPRLSWSNEEERVLDVGCGPGDVTAEILLPRLPPSSSLVGIDKNPKMVDYANKNYSSNRIMFKVLDFSVKNVTDVLQEKSFTKIFSFFCLHWIKDQEQVAKNIFKLIRPGCEFFNMSVSSSDVFKIYAILRGMKSWKSYMEDLDEFIPAVFYSTDPCKETEELLRSQGLEVITCQERERDITFSNMKHLLGSLQAINPFVKKMDQHTKEKYMADYEQIMKDNNFCKETASGEVLFKEKNIIIHGRRPHDVNFDISYCKETNSK